MVTPKVVVDGTMDDADNRNLEELHALLERRVQAAERASEEIGQPNVPWIEHCRQELRAYFGLGSHSFEDAPDMKSIRTKIDDHDLEYVELSHPDQLTIRTLRMSPTQTSRGTVLLMHGWPGNPADFFKNTGSGATKSDRGYGLELVEMGWTVYAVYCYHSKDPNLYYSGLKHAHNFVQLSRKAEVIGDHIISIELRKLDFFLSYLQHRERPEHLVFAGISMGGQYAALIGALNTDIDVTVCSSWFDDYYNKYIKEDHAHVSQYHWHEPLFMNELLRRLSAKKLAALHFPRQVIFERDPNDLPSDGDRIIKDEIETELDGKDFITVHVHSNMHNFAFKDVLEGVLK
jgi:dienelactone hydrolase